MNPQLIDMISSEPQQANPIVIYKWKELRPLNIYEIESKNPGSFVNRKTLDLKFGKSEDCEYLIG